MTLSDAACLQQQGLLYPALGILQGCRAWQQQQQQQRLCGHCAWRLRQQQLLLMLMETSAPPAALQAAPL
jgi:hypothetical protein